MKTCSGLFFLSTEPISDYTEERKIGAEAPGRGGKGGGRPSNFLQDHFSISPNSGVKIGGGGKADDLGSYNVYEHRILKSCHLNCIFP